MKGMEEEQKFMYDAILSLLYVCKKDAFRILFVFVSWGGCVR